MATRISRARRRGLTALVAVGATLTAMTVWGTPPASATDPGVTATGEFELESTQPLTFDSHGNITATSGQTSGPNAADEAAAGDDWSNVAAGTSSATASRFITDAVNSAPDEKLFTGGGSKDIGDITGWKWTSPSGVQDKNDIEHAYAARYDATGSLPSYVFFGLDRYSNAGDAALGFWFLKGSVAPIAGGSFNGKHQQDDLLVQILYTKGGGQPSLAVNKWCTAVNGAECKTVGLNLLASSNTQLCGVSTSQAYCAATNLKNETSPWGYVLKNAGTTPANTFAPYTFFEGGINLASFGLDRDCFSTFLAETRSSQPFTSTLSDFASGSFANCNATLATTPSAGETDATSVSPGTSVTDTATISGTGTTSPPYPSSSSTAPGTGNQVKFYLCGPIDSPATCTSTANQVGAAKDLAPTATQGSSSATSDAVNTAASPLTPGRYCWHATWDGDSNYPAITGESNASAECFVVRTIPTTTVTTPSDSSGTALSGNQPLGTSIYDKAVVTASASGGGAISGDVAFFLCSPSQVSGGVCPAGAGTAVGDPNVTPVAGSDPPQATALSNGTAANAAGTWCFRATFTPTGSTYTGSGDGRASECVTIDRAPTSTTTTPTLLSDGSTVGITSFLPVNSQVYDHAVVSATNHAAGAPTGTIHFYVCGPSALDANNRCGSGGTDLGTVGVTGQANSTSTANSSTVTANAVGRWCFRGVYSGDDNYVGSSDSAVNECFTVKDTTTATSAQNWLPNDTATINSTASGTTIKGTLAIQLYTGATCGVSSGSAVSGQLYSESVNQAGPVSFSTSNTTYKVSASTSVSWLVTFTSDDTNTLGSSSHCETTSMTITN